ncbi:hypothetical protein [Phocoenobacter skyensis]|uniref:Uncharacterized protein n=1 Tax=Phocoenobacter skyensis TaxID=97481 RepID=A0A1H7WVS5_9PAST|nr:hypothetical protein [Pasteurella skyensis]MDP8079325.1 hypothetical protein [Pasteurella skyensis]MDP8085454.1 hypothetical protein [Pasteurella skyensis]MDP8170532.1 hypothetical protein [Pasteurella skyensis]MDP8174506.1 hypothetical protein [Pasteurella skyensis]MDP8185191.1 hypothetical protein [Pasteurella skyensis]
MKKANTSFSILKLIIFLTIFIVSYLALDKHADKIMKFFEYVLQSISGFPTLTLADVSSIKITALIFSLLLSFAVYFLLKVPFSKSFLKNIQIKKNPLTQVIKDNTNNKKHFYTFLSVYLLTITIIIYYLLLFDREAKNFMPLALTWGGVLFAISIGIQSYYKRWEDELPKKLTAYFMFEGKCVMSCHRFDLANEADIRAWGQQAGKQMNNETFLKFDLRIETVKIEIIKRKYKHYEVKFYLESKNGIISNPEYDDLCIVWAFHDDKKEWEKGVIEISKNLPNPYDETFSWKKRPKN